MQLMTFNLKDKSGNCHQVQIDLSRLQGISRSSELASWVGPTLSVAVPDSWRYTLAVKQDHTFEVMPSRQPLEIEKDRTRQFVDRPADDAVSEGLRIIMLVLESPHVEEFKQQMLGQGNPLTAIAPAQGSTGRGINMHLAKVLEKVFMKTPLEPGSYAVVIANPIPYHCSLGHLADMQDDERGRARRPGLNEEVRNYIWKTLWHQAYIKNEFRERCDRYKPVIILNCCTKFVDAEEDSITLQHLVTEFLWQQGFRKAVWEAGHPSTWNKTINLGHKIRVEQVTPRKMQNRLKKRP